MSDLFGKLLSYQWRGIEFPCASFEVSLSQDQVEHKWPDRDGAHIEATGRNPIVFTAKVLFRNGVKFAKSEHKSGVTPMYPDVFRFFMTACQDRTTGTLQHPEFGAVQVKCKSAVAHWDPNKRDGVDVDVVWVETTDTLDEVFSNASPAAELDANAVELDDALEDYAQAGFRANSVFVDSTIYRVIPGLPTSSFKDLMNTITGAFDTGTLLTKQIAGKIDEVGYRLDVLSASIDRLADVKTWPIRQSIERLRGSLHKAKTRLLVATAPIAIYKVLKDSTLASISALLGSPVSELIRLNTGNISGPIVKAGTLLRYYRNLNDDS